MISTKKNGVRAAVALTVFAGLIGLNSLRANEIDEEKDVSLASASGAEFFAGSTYSAAPNDAEMDKKEKEKEKAEKEKEKKRKEKERAEKEKKAKSGKAKSESSDMGNKEKGKKGQNEDEDDSDEDEFFNWNKSSKGKPGH